MKTNAAREAGLDKALYEEWNKLHIEYTKLGYEKRNSLMADYCEELISKAKEVYYNSNEVIMSDNFFDRTERALRSLRPESKLLEKVGS